MSTNTDLPKPDASWEWSNHFQQSIKTESARSKVILSACYLDELLYQLLAVNLRPDTSKDDGLFDGATAPLGTFSAKIELAFRMSLIPDPTRKSLHLVRKIRNAFAHNITGCNFDDQSIATRTRELYGLNDVANPVTRARFSDGLIGDFECAIAFLIFWLKDLIDKVPDNCPDCGGVMAHRVEIKTEPPTE